MFTHLPFAVLPGAHVPRARDGEGEHVLRGVQATRVSPVQAGRVARQPQGHLHEQRLQDPQGTAVQSSTAEAFRRSNDVRGH